MEELTYKEQSFQRNQITFKIIKFINPLFWSSIPIQNLSIQFSLRNYLLTLKAPITTAADDKFCDIFPSFWQK